MAAVRSHPRSPERPMTLSNAINVPNLNPKLMVIGDSLAQGCRSLTVSAGLCAQSWGARVATLAGWLYLAPDHPRPVLFDREDELRRLNPAPVAPEPIPFRGLLDGAFNNIN